MKNYNIRRTYIKSLKKQETFFSAMSSTTRLQIIQLLQNAEMSIKDISARLNISSAVVTKHINILENAKIIESRSKAGERGLLKLCSLHIDEVLVVLNSNHENTNKNYTEIDIPIGSYANYNISAPCGIASKAEIIGIMDDSRYFNYPKRQEIALLWFTDGYIEYKIPTYDITFEKLKEITISMELCSEYPGFNNNYKSDICFYLNEHKLGVWTSPGDFGDRKGNYTPAWWDLGTEYGQLKVIQITQEGTYMNGMFLSSKSLNEVVGTERETLSLRIEAPKDTVNAGGINLFGHNFGDFNQDIVVRCIHEERSNVSE